MLDLFDAHGVKATFFVKGTLAEQHVEMAREIVAARTHARESHATRIRRRASGVSPPGRVAREIDDCNRALDVDHRRDAALVPRAGRDEELHRASGARAPRHAPDRLDRARLRRRVAPTPTRSSRRILPHLRPGAIIVLHQGREHSLRVLEHVIVALKERGYAFVIPDGRRSCAPREHEEVACCTASVPTADGSRSRNPSNGAITSSRVG